MRFFRLNVALLICGVDIPILFAALWNAVPIFLMAPTGFITLAPTWRQALDILPNAVTAILAALPSILRVAMSVLREAMDALAAAASTSMAVDASFPDVDMLL